MYSVEYDKTCGIIRCRIDGFLSDNEVGLIIAPTGAAKETCKRLHGDMKMLVTSDGQVQSMEIMKMVANQRASDVGIYDPRAFVLPTSLQKLQVGRVFNLSTEKHFISENAAIMWLLANRENRLPQV